MKFKNRLQFRSLSKMRLTIGLVVGLLYAFSFYSFSYILRETFRLLSLLSGNVGDLLILSDEEVFFYNLFYAFVAVILGQSVCFDFWYSRPQRLFGERNKSSSRVLNGPRVLNWYFLSWFSKLSLAFAIVFAMLGGYGYFSFYPDMVYFFVLIVAVLWMQTWPSIHTAFGFSMKWVFLSGIIISGLSFGMSRINLIDYHAINESVLKDNVLYTYGVNLPEASADNKLEHQSQVKDIYVVHANGDSLPRIITDNREVGMDVFVRFLNNAKGANSHPYFPVFRVFVDEDTEMKYMNLFEQYFAFADIHRIAYVVNPNNLERRTNEFYVRFCQPAMLMPSFVNSFDFPPPPPISELWSGDSLIITAYFADLAARPQINIKIDVGGNVLIDNVLVDRMAVKSILKKKCSEQDGIVMKLYYPNHGHFGDYIRNLAIINDVYFETMDTYSLAKTGELFHDCGVDEKLKIMAIHPITIIVVSPEMIPFLGE